MSAIKVKTGNRFEDSVSYSRAVAVDDWVFVANTAGRDHATGIIPEDAAEQCAIAVANVAKALAAVGSGLDEIVRLVVRIPGQDDVDAVTAVIGESFRGIDPAMSIVCTPLVGGHYAVELEATAHRGAAVSDYRKVSFA